MEVGRAVDQPGPGNYDANKKTGGPSYKFGAKNKSKQGTDAPGPGAYDPSI